MPHGKHLRSVEPTMPDRQAPRSCVSPSFPPVGGLNCESAREPIREGILHRPDAALRPTAYGLATENGERRGQDRRNFHYLADVELQAPHVSFDRFNLLELKEEV